MSWPTREEAFALLKQFTKNENLIKHALAVEAAMRAYAQKFGQDPDKWGVTGLLHDFDYEKYPSAKDHPFKGAKILEEKGYPEEMIQAILAHGDHTGVPRKTLLAKTLYAVDELTGLIVAVALVRPSKKISEVNVKSIMKKWKDKAFARGVNRENIEKGAKELGVQLEEHVECVLEAMKNVSEKLGL
ncbi:HAD family hydrolase [Candidatus Aerophobetes bacterium]|uniref:HAD family hydrolase n=1 Tax=Aerophobetes bacterium TaxID=2030807 RepID=A0A662D9G1_UNCAE|nr:MAG: HAD family hydrolase [Candidatus Aerophobetes bacterium]